MHLVEYPRPALEPQGAKNPTAGWAVAGMGLVPALGALETMLIGEELSLLGDRLHAIFGDDYARSGLVALIALGLCFVRLPLGIALAQGHRSGYRSFLALVLPLAALDFASWSLFAGLVWVAIDIAIAFRCLRRLRS